ncbi:MAG: hypothetical protein HYZ51_00670 [Candidatus Doudnabacteria bacterium]|nr:hypothetical protein [Candidatus Doudnabacteria bacterium]
MQHRILGINKLIGLLATWQGFSVFMIGIFNWPTWVIWLNLVLFLLFILAADVYKSVLLLLLLLPFYVVLPNAYFDTLSIWRPLFVMLFAVWFYRLDGIKASSPKLEKGRAAFVTKFLNRAKKIEFLKWDKFLAWFSAACLISLMWTELRILGIKQILFFLNIYLFYLVVGNTVNSREKIVEVIKFTIYSLTVIISLGFVQLFSTLVLGLDAFWVYWASFISRLYYGLDFARVALYSNSWFSFNGGRELRMFSILPDSQSFAYLCVFGVGFGLVYSLRLSGRLRSLLWSGVRFASLAVILSGTRAVWVGFLFPACAALYAYFKNFWLVFSKKFL